MARLKYNNFKRFDWNHYGGALTAFNCKCGGKLLIRLSMNEKTKCLECGRKFKVTVGGLIYTPPDYGFMNKRDD